MSKLRQHIEAAQTKNRYFKPSPLIKIEADYNNVASSNLLGHDLYEYRIEARFGARVVVQAEELKYTYKQMRAMICEEIFGEFRELLYDVKRALYEQKSDEADQAVNKILQRMF